MLQHNTTRLGKMFLKTEELFWWWHLSRVTQNLYDWSLFIFANGLEHMISWQCIWKLASWWYNTTCHALLWPSTTETVHVPERKSLKPASGWDSSFLPQVTGEWRSISCTFLAWSEGEKADDYHHKVCKKKSWLSRIKCLYLLEIKTRFIICTLLRIKTYNSLNFLKTVWA